jgi:hypothetical protein
MSVDRQMEFARIQGLLFKHGVPSTDQMWRTLKRIEKNVGNMQSGQIRVVRKLVEQILAARNHTTNGRIVAAVNDLNL